MTLIIAFIVSHLGVILGGLAAAGGVLFGFVKGKQADTKVAQAGQTAAQAQADAAAAKASQTQTAANAEVANARADAAASQAHVDATKESKDVEDRIEAMSDAERDQLRQQWTVSNTGGSPAVPNANQAADKGR